MLVTLQRKLNVVFVFVLSAVLLAAYTYQYVKMEEPCPLCLLQRLGLIGIGLGISLNIRFGIKMEHYALALFSCILGGGVALRQISLHVCPQFSTFGEPVLGYDLYVWSFIVNVCAVGAVAILLALYGFGKEKEIKPEVKWFEKLAISLLALISIANFITTLMECGLGACIG